MFYIPACQKDCWKYLPVFMSHIHPSSFFAISFIFDHEEMTDVELQDDKSDLSEDMDEPYLSEDSADIADDLVIGCGDQHGAIPSANPLSFTSMDSPHN